MYSQDYEDFMDSFLSMGKTKSFNIKDYEDSLPYGIDMNLSMVVNDNEYDDDIELGIRIKDSEYLDVDVKCSGNDVEDVVKMATLDLLTQYMVQKNEAENKKKPETVESLKTDNDLKEARIEQLLERIQELEEERDYYYQLSEEMAEESDYYGVTKDDLDAVVRDFIARWYD